MNRKIVDEPIFQKISIQSASIYLEKNALKKNTINIPLVITAFGIVFFIAFLLFVK